ncbi:hypothetical protein N7G274_008804 [Stereocaulon virgatum]|uniref:Uncharacterized protein n=1 Tax=Stereocaulon virgatum TaxID=373712 RepID=A0ABR3ZXW7_9LECA
MAPLPLLLPHSRPFIPLSLSLGLSTLYATHRTIAHPRPLHCDAAAATAADDPTPLTTATEFFKRYSRDAKVPIIKDGRLNPEAIRQVGAGSVLGLVGGVAVRTFSKTLALLFGWLIFGVKFLASRGFNIVPTSRIRKYVNGVDLRSAIEDDVAFKLSFGATFALASLAEF